MLRFTLLLARIQKIVIASIIDDLRSLRASLLPD
jgi:hypothetical protein